MATLEGSEGKTLRFRSVGAQILESIPSTDETAPLEEFA